MNSDKLIEWEKIKNYPFIDNPPTKGRGLIFGLIYDYEGDGFALYHPTSNGLVKIYSAPIKSYYFAKHLVDEEYDIYIPLIDRIFLQYSYPEVVSTASKILFNFNNLAVTFENYFLYQKLYLEKYGQHISELVCNNFSNFFIIQRSLYDLLQDLINKLYQVNVKKEYKKSFYKVAIKSEKDLRNNYNYTTELINFHKTILDHLNIIRKIRDDVVHKGISQDIIYSFEDGFGIGLNNSIIKELDIFPYDKKKPNEIVSVLCIFSYFTLNFMNDMCILTELIPRILNPEPPISKNYHYYIRLPLNYHFKRLREYFNNQWYNEPQIAKVYVGRKEDMTRKI